MAEVPVEAEKKDSLRAVKDLTAGAVGGIAQVLLGECAVFAMD
jgi:hypothetical protein